MRFAPIRYLICGSDRLNESQKRVIEYIRKNPAVSAVEVGRALGKTAADARHHLARLEEDGLVEVIGERRSGGRGRPEQLYRLSGMAVGDNLGLLAGALLNELQANLGKKGETALLQGLARYLAGKESPETMLHITRRLQVSVGRLNQLHYQARWEATASGPRLVLSNCPYGEIIREHPELCRMDAHIMEVLLGVPAEQTAKLEHSPRGGIFCAFLVSSK